MNRADLSPEAQEVWKALTKKQRRIIQKNYPIKKDRNIEICILRSRGVKFRVLAEITGLSRISINNITGRKSGLVLEELSVIKQDLKELQRLTGRMGHHLSEIERNK